MTAMTTRWHTATVKFMDPDDRPRIFGADDCLTEEEAREFVVMAHRMIVSDHAGCEINDMLVDGEPVPVDDWGWPLPS